MKEFLFFKMKYYFLSIGLILIAVPIVLAQPLSQEEAKVEATPNFFIADWEQALEISTTLQKPIFLFAYTDFKKTQCDKVLREIFKAPQVSNFYQENFINVKINLQTKAGIQFWKTYELRTYPSYLFFDASSSFISKTEGAKSSGEMLRLGQNVLQKIANTDYANSIAPIYTSFLDLKVQYQNGIRHPNFLYQYAYELKKFNDDYQTVVKEYLSNLGNAELYQSKNIQFIYDFSDNIDSKAFELLLDEQDIFSSYLGKNKVEKKLQSAIHSYILINAPSKNQQILPHALQLLDDMILENPDFAVFQAKILYFEHAENWLAYAKTTNDYLTDNQQMTDADMLHLIIENFVANVQDKKELDRSFSWLKKLSQFVEAPELVAELAAKIGKKMPSAKKRH